MRFSRHAVALLAYLFVQAVSAQALPAQQPEENSLLTDRAFPILHIAVVTGMLCSSDHNTCRSIQWYYILSC